MTIFAPRQQRFNDARNGQSRTGRQPPRDRNSRVGTPEKQFQPTSVFPTLTSERVCTQGTGLTASGFAFWCYARRKKANNNEVNFGVCVVA